MSGMFGGVFRRSPKKKVHPLPVLLSIGAGDGQQATVGTAVAVRPRFDTTYAADGTAAPGVPVNAIDSDGKQYHGVSDANGHWLLPSDWVMPNAVGVYALTATIAGSTASKTITATALAGAAVILVAVSALEQNANASTGVPVLPKVQVQDSQGNGVAGYAVTYAVTGGGGSGSGLSGVTDSDGFLEVGSWTTGGTAGLNSMTATAAGLIGSPITFHASVSASLPVSIEWFSGDGQSVAAGTIYTAPLVARVLDAGSAPVAGINVTLEALTGGGSVPVPIVTGSDGKASFLPTAGTVAGPGSWRAKFFDQGGLEVAVVDNMTIIAGPAHHLVITTQPDNHTTSGQLLPQQPVLKVADQYGNLVTAGTYHVTRSVVTGDATLSGNTTVDSVAGIVTYTALVVTDPTGGDSQIDFQATGLLDVISNSITTAPPTPDHQVIVTQPANQSLGSPQIVVVKTVDAGGGPIPGDTSPAVPTLTDNTEGATLTILNSVTVDGVTTIGYIVSGQTGSFTLTFARAGLPDVVSNPFNVTATNPWPNEPVGYVRFCEWNGSAIPANNNTGGSTPATLPTALLDGKAANAANTTTAPTTATNLSIVQDTSAPYSVQDVLKTRWPVGLSGQAPCNLQFWDDSFTTEKSKVFLGIIFKLIPDGSGGWQIGGAGTKFLGFHGYGQAPSVGINQSFTLLQGTPALSTPTIDTTFTPVFHQQGIVVRTIGGPTGCILPAYWYRMEFVFEINSAPGAADGGQRAYLTNLSLGTPQITLWNKSDVVYMVGANTHKFFRYTYNPTFGGAGVGSETPEAYMDHLYLSGVA